jgi:hypothetical protein
MWRHITGVEQPAKKIKLDNNEKLERKRTYDQVKRKRKNKLAEKPTLTELPGLSSNLINSYTTLQDLIAIEGIPHR